MIGEHPFSIPLNEMSIEELDTRYAMLINRWNIVRRMQMNEDILYQLDLFLSAINYEKERRYAVDDHPRGIILETDPLIIENNNQSKKRNK